MYDFLVWASLPTPFIVTWLVSATGNRAIPGLWLSLSALISPISVVTD